MRRSLRAEPEAHRVEVGFENRLKDDLRCRHDHPVGDRGNAEWPGLPRFARLWDVDPPQWLRPIGTGSKFCGEAVEKGPHRLGAPVLNVGDAHAVDAGSALVGGHVNPCPPHHITAGELVEEGMKATCAVLLGTAIEHALKGSDGVQAIGLSDGPSRILGTHQRPSQHCRAPMKQGPFARSRLCCPARHHYYDPLRLPPGCRPFPGVTGYRQARSRSPQIRGRVGPLQFPRHPSDRSTSPTPEGSSPPAPRTQAASMAFTKSTQARHPLAPPRREVFTTLQTSLHAADRPVARPRFDPGLSTGPGGSTTGDLGVSPDRTSTGWLTRACARLRHDHPFVLMASELLDARGLRLTVPQRIRRDCDTDRSRQPGKAPINRVGTATYCGG